MLSRCFRVYKGCCRAVFEHTRDVVEMCSSIHGMLSSCVRVYKGCFRDVFAYTRDVFKYTTDVLEYTKDVFDMFFSSKHGMSSIFSSI